MKFNLVTMTFMVLLLSCSSDDATNCAPSSNIQVSPDENFAYVSWDVGTSVYYGRKGQTPQDGLGLRVGLMGWAIISGLQPNTEYDAYFEHSCVDGTTSNLTGPIAFKTLSIGEGCTQPQNLRVVNVGSNSAVIAWDGLDETLWQIAYGPNYFLPTMESWRPTEVPSFELTNIEVGVAYDVHVYSDCGTLNSSTAAILNNVVLIPK